MPGENENNGNGKKLFDGWINRIKSTAGLLVLFGSGLFFAFMLYVKIIYSEQTSTQNAINFEEFKITYWKNKNVSSDLPLDTDYPYPIKTKKSVWTVKNKLTRKQ